ncbi:hypothetical protein H7849_11860 [Alloacidobacterium dinghuense]|uniref:Uncharacterized protein n=1 Tax=Alloacidobacterium dinghuense TaxID=2763107 RepID=A0A7G8BPQ1_9BACT|nr:hypothetical protein [Alloacidobacterium dinghuense]QNI34521.1 hypothetical protein H7849_11860 [Alloacidobacterium dinghuense]
MSAEHELVQTRRKRGIVLKLVRQGHEKQLSRMDDFEVWAILQDLGINLGRDQVLTMLQDLQILSLLSFKSQHNEFSGRVEIKQIELTAAGIGLVTRRKSTDDVLFD